MIEIDMFIAQRTEEDRITELNQISERANKNLRSKDFKSLQAQLGFAEIQFHDLSFYVFDNTWSSSEKQTEGLSLSMSCDEENEKKIHESGLGLEEFAELVVYACTGFVPDHRIGDDYGEGFLQEIKKRNIKRIGANGELLN
jgi:hypothetical protein